MAPRIVGRLKAKQVSNAAPPKGKDWVIIPDGGNLYLQATRGKDDHIRHSWLFKYEIAGKRREMGLGPLHTIGLADAREKATDLRKQLLSGIDPLAEKIKQRQALIAERAKAVTFKQVAEGPLPDQEDEDQRGGYLGLHLGEFKNAKHRYQWLATLKTYVYPKIGSMVVADIAPADVLRCIEPIWNTKRETASRIRQRIERILDYATVRQYRAGDNPALHVLEALPKGGNGKTHHAALPYADVPAFMAELRSCVLPSARALEFTILTSARTGETIGARLEEIDLKGKTWTIPAARMKAGKEHRVPLCVRAADILRGLGDQHGDLVFPFSERTMLALLQRMRPGCTVHGFRSAFTDWCHEQTAFPNVVIDMALAHTVSDKVEAAYRRGDLFEKRRKLMAAWERFCTTPAKPVADNIMSIGATGRG